MGDHRAGKSGSRDGAVIDSMVDVAKCPKKAASPARPSWFAVAARGTVVRRSLFYAVIVGPVLIAINHGDALLAGDIGMARAAKMVMTMAVPYLVSTFSSVSALRSATATPPAR